MTLLGLILTVFLAKGFANEADQFVNIERTGITKTAQRSYILAADGTILARLYLENREDTSLANVPEHVQRAFIAIEDERFYDHRGVDYHGIARALLNNIKQHKIVEGGSTITQQYVKNSLGFRDRTFSRKIKEAVLASRLENEYTKKQILEAYLNTIYFGHGAYGIQAASEVFFGKNARNLTLSEGALLAAVTKAPLNFSPYYHQDKAFKRQAVVLDRMANLGLITRVGAEEAKKNHPRLTPLKTEKVIAPYFVEHVKKLLIKEYGVEKVFKGGLRVHTTLNLRAQRIAEGAIARKLYLKKDPQAALVSIDPKTGHIIAMVGGRDFNNVKYNLATQGKRQPGSSFKIFVLVTALKQGISPDDTFNSSSPQALRISSSGLVPPWIVHNCEGHGYGMMPLREATVKSVNAVYANLTMRVGPKEVAKTAKMMGIRTPIRPFPAIGIGGLTIGVSPIEMASAFGTLANGGVHVEPTPIVKIVEPSGKIIMQTRPRTTVAMNKEIAYQAVDIMKGVILRGTATRANIGRPAAGKTGTNGQYRDAWFVGFTPNLATSVWMGYPEAQISMYSVHGSRGFGGIIPASIWNIYMGAMHKGIPVADFPIPAKFKKRDGREDTSTAPYASVDWSGSSKKYRNSYRWRKKSSQDNQAQTNLTQTSTTIKPQNGNQNSSPTTQQTTPQTNPQTTPQTNSQSEPQSAAPSEQPSSPSSNNPSPSPAPGTSNPPPTSGNPGKTQQSLDSYKDTPLYL